MNGPYTSLFELCVRITSQFEGADYDTVAGNFDDQGGSFGKLQFNIGSGSLQNYILRKCDRALLYNFPQMLGFLADVEPDVGCAWAKSRMYDSRGNMRAEWIAAWKKFLREPQIIQLQNDAYFPYWAQAQKICKRYGFDLSSRRCMVWAFDVAVQNWNITEELPEPSEDRAFNCINIMGGKNRELWMKSQLGPQQTQLIILSYMRAMRSKERWRDAVFARKATIAIGTGYVNGKLFELNVDIMGS